jgi:hypothetical protein
MKEGAMIRRVVQCLASIGERIRCRHGRAMSPVVPDVSDLIRLHWRSLSVLVLSLAVRGLVSHILGQILFDIFIKCHGHWPC